jgi:hypothetical protein
LASVQWTRLGALLPACTDWASANVAACCSGPPPPARPPPFRRRPLQPQRALSAKGSLMHGRGRAAHLRLRVLAQVREGRAGGDLPVVFGAAGADPRAGASAAAGAELRAQPVQKPVHAAASPGQGAAPPGRAQPAGACGDPWLYTASASPEWWRCARRWRWCCSPSSGSTYASWTFVTLRCRWTWPCSCCRWAQLYVRRRPRQLPAGCLWRHTRAQLR